MVTEVHPLAILAVLVLFSLTIRYLSASMEAYEFGAKRLRGNGFG